MSTQRDVIAELDKEANELSVKINRLNAHIQSGVSDVKLSDVLEDQLEYMGMYLETIIRRRALLIREKWGNKK